MRIAGQSHMGGRYLVNAWLNGSATSLRYANRMTKRLLCPMLLSMLIAPVAALAAPVNIQVLGADGAPLQGAIVSLAMPGVAAPQPRGPYRISQQNIAFDPGTLIVPVGASVSFPNLDRVRHHVYSFSPAKRFDLKLYGRDESRSIVFDKPGVVALGCNIHDRMNGVVYVTTTPYAAVTDASGRVAFSGVDAGRGVLTVWHPSIRAGGNVLSQPAIVQGSGLSTQLRIRR